MSTNIPNVYVDVLFATSQIFVDDPEYWTYLECEKGFIRFRGNFWFGSAGIEGSLSIGIPPKDSPTFKDIELSQDIWEGSRSLLDWDWWKCLGITTIPPSEGNLWEFGFDIVFFIELKTFFDAPLQRLKTIKILDNAYDDLICNYVFPFDSFEKCKDHVFEDENIRSDCCSFFALKFFLKTEFDARFIRFELADIL